MFVLERCWDLRCRKGGLMLRRQLEYLARLISNGRYIHPSRRLIGATYAEGAKLRLKCPCRGLEAGTSLASCEDRISEQFDLEHMLLGAGH